MCCNHWLCRPCRRGPLALVVVTGSVVLMAAFASSASAKEYQELYGEYLALKAQRPMDVKKVNAKHQDFLKEFRRYRLTGTTASGSTGAGSTDTGTPASGSTGTGSTGTGTTASGSPGTGSTDTGTTASGSTGTGSTDTGTTASGSTGTGSTGTGTTASGSPGTGSTDTGTTDDSIGTAVASSSDQTTSDADSGLDELTANPVGSSIDANGAMTAGGVGGSGEYTGGIPSTIPGYETAVTVSAGSTTTLPSTGTSSSGATTLASNGTSSSSTTSTSKKRTR